MCFLQYVSFLETCKNTSKPTLLIETLIKRNFSFESQESEM